MIIPAFNDLWKTPEGLAPVGIRSFEKNVDSVPISNSKLEDLIQKRSANANPFSTRI